MRYLYGGSSPFYGNLPVIAYSYSGKGFDIKFSLQDDFRNLCDNTFEKLETFLFSLFDFSYCDLSSLEMFRSGKDKGRLIFWDSGGYEVDAIFESGERSEAYKGSRAPWGEDFYVKAAQSAPIKQTDVVISLDEDSMDVYKQIDRAKDLFESIGGKFKREYFIKLQPTISDYNHSTTPEELEKALSDFVDDIDILGVAQKDLGPTWISQVSGLIQIRKMLNKASGSKYVPIHVLGCMDPKSIIYLCLCGADIFDGLSWQRYFFTERDAYYDKEFEYRIGMEDLYAIVNESDRRGKIILNNIKVLEDIKNKLSLCILRKDFKEFKAEITYLSSFIAQGN